MLCKESISFFIEDRKQFGQYGDSVVEKNIDRLMAEIRKPDQEMKQRRFYGVGLGRVPEYLLLIRAQAGPDTPR